MLKKLFQIFLKEEENKEVVDPREEELKQATEDFIEALKELKDEKDNKEKLLDRALEFEIKFYELISGSSKFKILPIPDIDGTYPSEKDVKKAQEITRKENNKLIYQVRYLDRNGQPSNIEVVTEKDSDLIGLIYPTDELGYHA